MQAISLKLKRELSKAKRLISALLKVSAAIFTFVAAAVFLFFLFCALEGDGNLFILYAFAFSLPAAAAATACIIAIKHLTKQYEILLTSQDLHINRIQLGRTKKVFSVTVGSITKITSAQGLSKSCRKIKKAYINKSEAYLIETPKNMYIAQIPPKLLAIILRLNQRIQH